MELENCAEREGLILLMTTNEPDKVHFRQWVGKSQAHEEHAAKERGKSVLSGLPGSVFEGVTCSGGMKSSSEDGSCRKALQLIWGRTKENIKCCKRSMSFSGEGLFGLERATN